MSAQGDAYTAHKVRRLSLLKVSSIQCWYDYDYDCDYDDNYLL